MMLYDRTIREPLFDWLEGRYGKQRILEEIVIGKSRADVVLVLSSEIWGIEIKSDADTYTRLSAQVKDYNRYFDRNILVVGTRHAHHAAEHVPDHWGIITVEPEENRADFYELRKPGENPKVKLEKQITLLWRPELVQLQKQFHLPAYAQKSKKFVQEKLLEKVPSKELKQAISEVLFERDYTMIEETIEAYRRMH